MRQAAAILLAAFAANAALADTPANPFTQVYDLCTDHDVDMDSRIARVEALGWAALTDPDIEAWARSKGDSNLRFRPERPEQMLAQRREFYDIAIDRADLGDHDFEREFGRLKTFRLPATNHFLEIAFEQGPEQDPFNGCILTSDQNRLAAEFVAQSFETGTLKFNKFQNIYHGKSEFVRENAGGGLNTYSVHITITPVEEANAFFANPLQASAGLSIFTRTQVTP